MAQKMAIWGQSWLVELPVWPNFTKKIKNVSSRLSTSNFFLFFFQELENWATGGNQFFPRIFLNESFSDLQIESFLFEWALFKNVQKRQIPWKLDPFRKESFSRNDQTWLNKNGCKASLASPPGGENENECWNTLASSNLCNIYTFKIVFIVRESKLRSF